MITLLSLISCAAFAAIDMRFPESPTFMQNASMIRFQYMSHEGPQCGSEITTNLRSRVPYYVYAPATSATQLKQVNILQ